MIGLHWGHLLCVTVPARVTPLNSQHPAGLCSKPCQHAGPLAEPRLPRACCLQCTRCGHGAAPGPACPWRR